MTAAVVKFKSLGIEKMVKNLELSELGNHIAVKLREMTGKKRKEVDGKRNPFRNALCLNSPNTYMRRARPKLPQIAAINANLEPTGPNFGVWPRHDASRLDGS